MTQGLPDDHIRKKTPVLRVPGMDQVRVLKEVEYEANDGGTLTMDLYHPGGAKKGELRPAVVSVLGYPDPGMERLFGRRFKDWGWSTSWARLVASAGLVAVTYSNREPLADLRALLRQIRENGSAHGIDASRIGLLACSGHGPLALSALMSDPEAAALRCAALLYPFTLDLDGFTSIEDAARTFRFSNPSAGRSVNDLPTRTPIFLARAGQDQMPGLNESLDRFLAHALRRNLPVTLMNHAEAPHAFDLDHDSGTTRDIIRAALGFLRSSLLTDPSL